MRWISLTSNLTLVSLLYTPQQGGSSRYMSFSLLSSLSFPPPLSPLLFSSFSSLLYRGFLLSPLNRMKNDADTLPISFTPSCLFY
jgi:hypothetical protein